MTQAVTPAREECLGYSAREECPGYRTAMPWPVRLVLVYLAAITIFGKGPTYLGVPPLFWGEAVLAAALAWVAFAGRLPGFPLPKPKGLSAAICLFLALGAVLTGLYLPRWGLDAARDAAIWYYAAFAFVGLAIAAREALAERVWTWLRVFWVLAMIWGVADDLSGRQLSQNGPLVPWRNVPVTWNSVSEMMQHMALGSLLVLATGLLRRRPVLRAVLSLVALGGLMVAAKSASRGFKVGLALGLVIVTVLSLAPGRPLRIHWRLFRWLALAAILLVLAAVVLDLDLASMTNFSRFARDEGTSSWRLIWWERLFEQVLSSNPAFGLGFGANLDVFNPTITLNAFDPWPTRSPHNYNVTVFSRMGLAGLAVWLAILGLGIGGLFARTWRNRPHPAAESYTPERREELAFWLLMLACSWGNGSFGVLMEGPALGIWFWFALGFATGRSLTPGPLAPWPSRPHTP